MALKTKTLLRWTALALAVVAAGLAVARFAAASTTSQVLTAAHTQQTCGGDIPYGQTLRQKNHQGWPHCDYWFSGRDGDLVEIQLEPISRGLNLQIGLVDPTETYIATSTSERLSYRLNRGTGRYGFRLTSAGKSSKYGAFRVSLINAGGHAQTCGGEIRYGQTLVQRNHEGWPHCDYWFSGNEGDQVDIRVIVSGGNLKPWIGAVDPSQTYFAESKTGRLLFSLKRGNGRYGFRVTSAVNPRTYGPFQVSLEGRPPVSPVTQPVPARIPPTQTSTPPRTTSPTGSITGAFRARNAGTQAATVQLLVQGSLVTSSGGGTEGRTAFRESFSGQLPPGNGQLPGVEGAINFSVGQLRPGTWTVTSTSNATGPVTCSNVRVPGFLSINVNASNPSLVCTP